MNSGMNSITQDRGAKTERSVADRHVGWLRSASVVHRRLNKSINARNPQDLIGRQGDRISQSPTL